jgi:hypothetical protein
LTIPIVLYRGVLGTYAFLSKSTTMIVVGISLKAVSASITFKHARLAIIRSVVYICPFGRLTGKKRFGITLKFEGMLFSDQRRNDHVQRFHMVSVYE